MQSGSANSRQKKQERCDNEGSIEAHKNVLSRELAGPFKYSSMVLNNHFISDINVD